MKEKKSKRINDKGFTLVELLIAIAIVAIIVAPMLDGIVTSMKVNKKADALQKETAVANSVMESMENMSLDDIAVKLSDNNSDIKDMFPEAVQADKNNFRVGEISGGTGCIEEKEITNAETGAKTYEYKFNKNSTGKYVFALNDIIYDKEKYDVRVTLDATHESYDSFNDAKYVDIAGFDKTVDAMYVQDDLIDKEICGSIATDATAMGTPFTADDIDARATRTITVKILKATDKDASGKEYEYTKVTVDYERAVSQALVGPDGKYKDSRIDGECYSNRDDTTKELRNLYIMYNPNYNSDDYSKEKIIINNEANIPVTVYLIKQNTGVFNLEGAEQGYRVEVTSTCSKTDGTNPTTIRTNLGYNLSKLLEAENYDELGKCQQTGQCKLILRNDYSNVEETYSGANFYKKISTLTGGSNEYVRMFDKKVEIFPSDAITTDETTGKVTFAGESVATMSSAIDGIPTPAGP